MAVTRLHFIIYHLECCCEHLSCRCCVAVNKHVQGGVQVREGRVVRWYAVRESLLRFKNKNFKYQIAMWNRIYLQYRKREERKWKGQEVGAERRGKREERNEKREEKGRGNILLQYLCFSESVLRHHENNYFTCENAHY